MKNDVLVGRRCSGGEGDSMHCIKEEGVTTSDDEYSSEYWWNLDFMERLHGPLVEGWLSDWWKEDTNKPSIKKD